MYVCSSISLPHEEWRNRGMEIRNVLVSLASSLVTNFLAFHSPPTTTHAPASPSSLPPFPTKSLASLSLCIKAKLRFSTLSLSLSLSDTTISHFLLLFLFLLLLFRFTISLGCIVHPSCSSLCLSIKKTILKTKY